MNSKNRKLIEESIRKLYNDNAEAWSKIDVDKLLSEVLAMVGGDPCRREAMQFILGGISQLKEAACNAR